MAALRMNHIALIPQNREVAQHGAPRGADLQRETFEVEAVVALD